MLKISATCMVLSMKNLWEACWLATCLLTAPLWALASHVQVPGIHYCDSSAGRYVLENSDFSSQYCTRHAVMNMDKFEGCCTWHGGVAKATQIEVICNDGSKSELCALQIPHDNAAIY